MSAFFIIPALLCAWLVWRFLHPIITNRGLVVGPWVQGWNKSKGYWWSWLGRKGDGWTIRFKPEGSLHAVQDFSFRIPAGATKLVWNYRIEGANAFPTELPTSAPTVSLVLQRKGDDWLAEGDKAFFRLYSPAFPLINGEHTREIPLEGWSGVLGGSGDVRPVIANLSNLAVAFGHAGGRMHGVGGVGTFTQISLRAE